MLKGGNDITKDVAGLVNRTDLPISIVIPTLNEAESIRPLLQRINSSLVGANIKYEVIIIDDRSDDETVKIANDLAHNLPIRIIEKAGRAGKAFSLLEGFSQAKYPIICMIDADLQYPPESIPLMHAKLEALSADIVLTDRRVNKTGLLRRLSSSIFNLLFTRLLFGFNYDIQSGLKLFRKTVLERLTIDPSPWTFDLEFIVKSLENDYVIVSEPIVFSDRQFGTPKIKLFGATIEIVRGALRVRNVARHSHSH